MTRALAPILAAAALLRAAAAPAPQPPDCALWSVRDGGCFATSCEFCRGRDSGACP